MDSFSPCARVSGPVAESVKGAADGRFIFQIVFLAALRHENGTQKSAYGRIPGTDIGNKVGAAYLWHLFKWPTDGVELIGERLSTEIRETPRGICLVS